MKRNPNQKQKPRQFFMGGDTDNDSGPGAGPSSSGVGDTSSSGISGDSGYGGDGGGDGGGSYSFSDISNPAFGITPGIDNASVHGPSGYSYSELAAMQAAGKGGLDLGTQTVDQALAAQSFNQGLTSFAQSMLSPAALATFAAGPVAGAVVSGLQSLSQGATVGQVVGQIGSGLVANALTNALGVPVSATAVNSALSGNYGQAALQTATGAVAQAIGVSPSVVSAMAQGQFGPAAANLALGALTGELAQALGTNPAIVGTVLNETGLSQQIGQSISSVVGNLAPELSAQVSAMYGSIAGLKGEGLDLGSLGGLMGLSAQQGAVQNEALTQAITGGNGPGTGIAAPGVGAAMANTPSTSGLAALAALYGAQKGAAAQAEKSEESKKQAEAEQQQVQLFSSDIFARPQAKAGGGMVKKYADGGFMDINNDGQVDWEDDYLYMQDPEFYQDWQDVTGGNYTVDEIGDSYSALPSNSGAMDKSMLERIFGGLTEAGKKLFLTDKGDIDFAKLAGIAGGIYGYNKAKDYDISNVGFSGQIPQLVAARAQVPYQYDAERRPGSYGRRYLSDMYFATPENKLATQTKALEQAQGIAALQRADGSMRTAIAPGGIGGVPRAEPESPIIPNEPAAPAPAPTPLYQSLTAKSTPEQIAAAYEQWASGQGGDTAANRATAQDFLQNIGIAGQDINRAYDVYRGTPLDQYKNLTGQSSAQDIARAYSQYIGAAPTMGDVEANQQTAVSYLKNLGLSDEAIGQAYQTFLNKQFAAGGIATLAKGGPSREPRYLAGSTNGQSDEIETTIDGEQPALLSHGEFVVPADVVSALGGGNSEAGAEALYSMMDRVRQQAFGRKQQMNQVNPDKVMPA